VASPKSRKCEATNDAECLPESHVAEPNRAEHSAEFFRRASVSAELRPISTDYTIVTCDRYSAPQHGRLDCCWPAFVAIASGVHSFGK